MAPHSNPEEAVGRLREAFPNMPKADQDALLAIVRRARLTRDQVSSLTGLSRYAIDRRYEALGLRAVTR